jgi:hypothetical protein
MPAFETGGLAPSSSALSDDDRLDQAEALVRDWCGWHIAPSKTETITVDGSGVDSLVLPTKYLTAVTSVTEDGVALTEGVNFRWSQAGVIYRIDWCRFTRKRQAVVVEFSHGYASPPVAVQSAIADLATTMDTTDAGLIRNRQVGQVTEGYSPASTDPILSRLEPYRLEPAL